MALIRQSDFVFPGINSRVVFGAGTLAGAGDEIERLGRKRALVLSTPDQAGDAKNLAERLGKLVAGTFCEAAMHVPLEVTQRALAHFRTIEADCVVSLGGGSTVGLGKAIAVRTSADHVAIPTSYAGSEMTDILGETDRGEKTTRRAPEILPETVIYDVELTLGLPPAMTMTSALNAIAHAAEALYAHDRNPVISIMAGEAVRAFADALPVLAGHPRDREARTAAQYAAWLCGAALGGTSMALHHKICHTLGGSFDTPHAETHAIMLPHTIGYNAEAAPDLLEPLAAAFGGAPGAGLFDFAARICAPQALKSLGLSEADLDRAADLATRNPYWNPRPFDRDSIRALLQDAWLGARPRN